jgi:hypothetical protein
MILILFHSSICLVLFFSASQSYCELTGCFFRAYAAAAVPPEFFMPRLPCRLSFLCRDSPTMNKKEAKIKTEPSTVSPSYKVIAYNNNITNMRCNFPKKKFRIFNEISIHTLIHNSAVRLAQAQSGEKVAQSLAEKSP